MQGFLQVVAALFFIALIFFLAWFIPRLLARSNVLGMKGRHLTVIDKVQVAKDCYVVILKMFDKVMVLGVTPGGITTLGGLDADVLGAEEDAPQAQSFSQIFRSALGMQQTPGGVHNPLADFIRKKGREDDEKKAR